MKINAEGLQIIKDSEGLRLNAYICPAGVWTIGWGTTGKRVVPGLTIDRATADKWLADHVISFEKAVISAVKVRLNSNQFSALVSFVYNIGTGAFAKSTLLRKLNNGDYSGAANEFKRWNKGGGRVLQGLVIRRKKEESLFLKPVVAMADEYKDNNSGLATDNVAEKIRITFDTYLKSGTLSNTTMEDGTTKVKVYKGTDFPILAAKNIENKNHTIVTFGYYDDKKVKHSIEVANKNTWYLFNDHFTYGADTIKDIEEKETSVKLADSIEDKIAAVCENKGYPLNKDEYNIVGISGFAPTDKSSASNPIWNIDVNNIADKWNDSVLVLKYDTNTQNWTTLKFVLATTEPGRYYTINPLNIGGAARLDYGLHKDLWSFGLHKGYRALTQTGTARLVRDKNKNFKADDKVSFEKWRGVNLHTTGKGASLNSIGRWSAGCVVIFYPTHFQQTLRLLEESPQYKKNRNCSFDFRLLDVTWLEL